MSHANRGGPRPQIARFPGPGVYFERPRVRPGGPARRSTREQPTHGHRPQIARVLDEMGTLLELQGENPFRCRAYHNAAAGRCMACPADLAEMSPTARWPTCRASARRCLDEDHPARDHRPAAGLRGAAARDAAGPGGLLRVRAWGPRRSRPCTTTLKIESLADLQRPPKRARSPSSRASARRPRPRSWRGSRSSETSGDRILQSTARRLVAPVFEAIREHPGRHPGRGCGSLRRRARRSATSTSSSAPRTRGR